MPPSTNLIVLMRLIHFQETSRKGLSYQHKQRLCYMSLSLSSYMHKDGIIALTFLVKIFFFHFNDIYLTLLWSSINFLLCSMFGAFRKGEFTLRLRVQAILNLKPKFERFSYICFACRFCKMYENRSSFSFSFSYRAHTQP